MPTASWELEYGAARKTFSAWGLANLRIDFLSMDADEVTFVEQFGAVDAPDLFPYEAVISIYHPNGTRWFTGFVVEAPSTGEPDVESRQYVVKNLWHILDTQLLQAQRTYYVGGLTPSKTTTFNPHILLNLHPSLLQLELLGDTISDILDFAIAQNAGKFQKGTKLTTTLPLYPPVDEVRDLMCGEAIRKEVKWAPDSTSRVDYTASPPKLNFYVRETAGTIALAIGQQVNQKLESISDAKARYDLQYSAVRIVYDIKVSINGQDRYSVSEDVWPPGANSAARDTLVASVDLLGPSKTTTSADITTTPILADSADLPAQLQWWKDHFPQLKDARVDPDSISIGIGSVAVPAGQTPLPNELIAGNVAPWMQDADLQIRKQKQEWKAKIFFRMFKTSDHVVSATNKPTIDATKDGQIFIKEFTATDAETGTYESLQTADSGDPQPVGLAKYIQSIISILQWQGRVRLFEAEVGGEIRPGMILNLTGGKPEWQTMNAVVTAVTEDVDEGTTDITFGPAPHLSIQDIISFLKNTRLRLRYTRAQNYLDGDTPGGEVELGDQTEDSDSNVGEPVVALDTTYGAAGDMVEIKAIVGASGEKVQVKATSGVKSAALTGSLAELKLDDGTAGNVVQGTAADLAGKGPAKFLKTKICEVIGGAQKQRTSYVWRTPGFQDTDDPA